MHSVMSVVASRCIVAGTYVGQPCMHVCMLARSIHAVHMQIIWCNDTYDMLRAASFDYITLNRHG
jgi:hypothetical protein